jgi:hypothetical protein
MLNLFAVLLVDTGIAGSVIGLLSIVWPLRFLGIRSRRTAVAVVALSVAVMIAGMLIPAPLQVATDVRSDLDRAMPAWQFDERHAITIDATPERVYQAIKSSTADEILLFRTLIAIRYLVRKPDVIRSAPSNRPLLDVATFTTFAMLSDTPREIVVGTVVNAPPGVRRTRAPTPDEILAAEHLDGFAVATMNFAIAPRNDGACDVTTETRVFATDPGTRRRFGAYWHVIYPGSALIRRMWLRAIKVRAEAPAATLSRGHATPRRSVSDSSRRGPGAIGKS